MLPPELRQHTLMLPSYASTVLRQPTRALPQLIALGTLRMPLRLCTNALL
jgi:hypothetical protein